MTLPRKSQRFFIWSILLVPLQFIPVDRLQAAEDLECQQNPRRCSGQDLGGPIDRAKGTYLGSKPKFSANQRPNAFWASKPTGKFTKQEIFDVCSETAFLGYTALDARIKGEPKSKRVDGLTAIIASTYEKRYPALKERDPLIYERGKKLYVEFAERLYDTAYNGGDNSLANLLQRDGFEQFYPKLISGCYRNLASW